MEKCIGARCRRREDLVPQPPDLLRHISQRTLEGVGTLLDRSEPDVAGLGQVVLNCLKGAFDAIEPVLDRRQAGAEVLHFAPRTPGRQRVKALRPAQKAIFSLPVGIRRVRGRGVIFAAHGLFGGRPGIGAIL